MQKERAAVEALSQYNYFDIFEIPIGLSFDISEIEKKYFELTKKLHPDRHQKIDAETKNKILELSAIINQAYLTLKNKESTLEYLLSLTGIQISENKNQTPEILEMVEAFFELNDSIDENEKEILKKDLLSKLEILREKIFFEALNLANEIDWTKATHSDKTLFSDKLNLMANKMGALKTLDRLKANLK
jgi:molecular chaperone HscB